jgi:hypothetical protein
MKRSLHFLAAISLLFCVGISKAGDEITEAEQRIFVDHHFGNVKPGTILKYAFHQSGVPDGSFDDRATLTVGAAPAESAPDARKVRVDFLSGVHKFELPEFDSVESNPAILYFLEMDVRDMHRALGGQEAYFRKRIRLALARSATVDPVTIQFGGRSLKASAISITPFADDNLKERLKNYAGKRYLFVMCPDVPGAVVRIETTTSAPSGSTTSESGPHSLLLLDGV